MLVLLAEGPLIPCLLALPFCFSNIPASYKKKYNEFVDVCKGLKFYNCFYLEVRLQVTAYGARYLWNHFTFHGRIHQILVLDRGLR